MTRKSKATPSKKSKKSKRGGARPGAGRPASKLPAEVLQRLGPPPSEAKALRMWNAQLLAEVQWLAINGRIPPELAASIRANAGAIERVLPPAPPPRAHDDDDQDDDDVEAAGPELTEVASDGSLVIEH